MKTNTVSGLMGCGHKGCLIPNHKLVLGLCKPRDFCRKLALFLCDRNQKLALSQRSFPTVLILTLCIAITCKSYDDSEEYLGFSYCATWWEGTTQSNTTINQIACRKLCTEPAYIGDFYCRIFAKGHFFSRIFTKDNSNTGLS